MSSYCGSGGSCFTCCAEMDFPENNSQCVQTSTWHTARDGSDYDGTGPWVHFVRAGLRAIPSLSLLTARLQRRWFLSCHGSVCNVELHCVVHLNFLGIVVQGSKSTKCSGIHSGFDAPVVLHRQVTR